MTQKEAFDDVKELSVPDNTGCSSLDQLCLFLWLPKQGDLELSWCSN